MSQSSATASGQVTKTDLDMLMAYHDRQFVELAYQLILGRPADDSGLAHHLQDLRSGESRREIAFRIATSEEASAKGFDRRLFDDYRRWRRLERIPVIGALLLILICMKRIRFLVREFRRVQNSAYGGSSQGSAQASRL